MKKKTIIPICILIIEIILLIIINIEGRKHQKTMEWCMEHFNNYEYCQERLGDNK